ncbi:hypothetical protein [Photorhabdus hindustanensis]|uniref:hypothetical protein n=1 Tax=Photorhabdus hindustanensis TaxID=2918802 RepID=UPI0020017DE4|nr:hypothetical protein [Photorhabdus hindustanensis]
MDFNIKIVILAIFVGIVAGISLNKMISVFPKIIYGYEKIDFGYFQVELVTLFITAFFYDLFSIEFTFICSFDIYLDANYTFFY